MPRTSASELTPPAEQIARFRRDLEALAGRAPGAGNALGVGVSGGADSVALLLLAAAAYPGTVRAATVDHGLRPEAAAEAAGVAALCARLDVPHTILHPPPDAPVSGNLQERAREMRYAALAHWADGMGVRWLAVGHQRDDVAEGFLMRARRGAGVAGLSAMPAVRPLRASDTAGVMLLRPLLQWSREELAAVPRCLRVEVVQDSSNRDPRFDRSRIRALIAEAAELVPARLAMAARNLRHAEDALQWIVERELPHRLLPRDDGRVTLEVADLPYELRRRFVRLAVQRVRDHHGFSGLWHDLGIDRLVATLDAGGIGTIAGVKAVAKHDQWSFEAAPPRRSH